MAIFTFFDDGYLFQSLIHFLLMLFIFVEYQNLLDFGLVNL